MGSILDILTGGPIGAMLDGLKNPGSGGGIFGGGSPFGDSSSSPFGGSGGSLSSALQSIANKARSAAGSLSSQTSGGMGGLLGAGALGAILGNLLSSDAVKGVALAGAGAAAWNFYKKWAQSQKQAAEAPEAAPKPASHATQALPQKADPTAELIMRAMNYAARADGRIDPEERARMDAVLAAMLPGENLTAVMESIDKEPIDPSRLAANLQSPEQGHDVYRLSCMTIDIDHFMERSYLDTLAKVLNLSPSDQKSVEAQAEQAKKSLAKAIPAN